MKRLLIPALILIGLALTPLASSGSAFTLTLLSRAMILGTAAISLSLLVGGAGLISLGHAAAMGVGAYTVAALDAGGITGALAVFPTAILTGGLFALVTGAVSLRTSGVHFIMITLAFGQMAFFTAASLSVLGGDDGYTLYARTEVFGTSLLQNRLVFYFVCLALLVLVWLLASMILDSRFGRVLQAAKQNPIRVQALGLSPYPFRLVAYTLAGGISGLAGALLANASAFVSPATLSWDRSGELLFMVILGGIKYINKVIPYKTEADLLKFLKEFKPDVRIIGADWEGKEYTGHELSIPIYFNKRDHGYSTSELRNRVFEAELARRNIDLGQAAEALYSSAQPPLV